MFTLSSLGLNTLIIAPVYVNTLDFDTKMVELGMHGHTIRNVILTDINVMMESWHDRAAMVADITVLRSL